ncbi:glutathione S-transferase [Vibrio sp. T187]|uniref:glutathione S-transferase n=1 Tax=Vibrio TaxID=662 RepID=UPI0010C9CD7B|nr:MULTISPECIES: glutathione S-transferase [Vibrio]MBW3696680.1 glutathione S-transferase [Vibrio sp. T187]
MTHLRTQHQENTPLHVPRLIVGTDSTWSLRAWMCAQLAGSELNIIVIDLAKEDYKDKILAYSPTGLVPALQHGATTIHDSLAISEYFNELSTGRLYPESAEQRALARSYCAEMHSGFFEVRSQCPFTLDKTAPVTEPSSAFQKELERIEQIFSQAQGPFMFNEPSMVDAFYSILAFRLSSYGITLAGEAGQYQQSLLEWPLLQQAIDLASSWRKNDVEVR